MVFPSGEGQISETAPSETRQVVLPSATSTRKAATQPNRSATKKTDLESGAQTGASGQRSRSGVRSRPSPVAISTSQIVRVAASSCFPEVPREATTKRPSGENLGCPNQKSPPASVRRVFDSISITTSSTGVEGKLDQSAQPATIVLPSGEMSKSDSRMTGPMSPLTSAGSRRASGSAGSVAAKKRWRRGASQWSQKRIG